MDQIKKLLTSAVEEVIVRDELERVLRSGKKLRIKFGIDPTAPEIHLGHAVVLRKLREFQDLGHKVILIIGDFTAKIGDPTGRTASRKSLSRKDIAKNMETYKKQIGKILNVKKLEFVYNSKWLDKLKLDEILRIAGGATLQQIKEREEFRKRLEEGREISLPELLYPLFQAYDSVMVKADVEVGGLDQKFNLLMGRQLQEKFSQKPQNILLTPLLLGTDGQKMSKSAKNYVGIIEGPAQQFGKLMSIPDNLTTHFAELCTDLPLDELKRLDPLTAKKRLAREIVRLYHGEKEAENAQKEFTGVFGEGGVPKGAPVWKIAGKKVNLLDLLVEKKVSKSKSEARRLLEQGGISLNDRKLSEPEQVLNKGVLRIGKKTFTKIE